MRAAYLPQLVPGALQIKVVEVHTIAIMTLRVQVANQFAIKTPDIQNLTRNLTTDIFLPVLYGNFI